MRTAIWTRWIMLAGAPALLALACADPAAAPQQPADTAQPAAGDGKHFLADKPLKLFEEQKSERWKFLESISQAE